ncbi:MAG: 16S rRNA processing protein RimM [Rhodospirillales bacterium]|nr:16S rRNA processing protein RimM [Rhodospirillales bacterium]
MTIDDKNAPDDTASDNPDLVCLGRIGGAHGLRGAVRIQTFTDEPEDIGAYGPLVSPPGDRRFHVTVQRRVKSGVIARVAGVDSRHAAMELKGIRLFVARDVLPPPGDDEFYHADLVGMTAVALDGATLGRVIAVWNFGAGDVLELKAAKSGKAVMLPFDRQVVPTVDLAGGMIRIDVPESLKEDLN